MSWIGLELEGEGVCPQVLANVALRLADFHAAGYVHRDLKPANVMWLPRENRWTVIDFGCAGRTDTTVPLSFTLVYAAPEVVNALKVIYSSLQPSLLLSLCTASSLHAAAA